MTVASPMNVPVSAMPANSAEPASVTAACEPSTPNRVTGWASTISIVPRFSSPLTESDPRDTAQTVTSNSTIGSSYSMAIRPAVVAICE